jgi:predicted DNA-binding transcriptional regulator AlpA
MDNDGLKDTKWLAKLLGLCVNAIEKRRSKDPESLPPCVRIGSAVRYLPSDVYAWLEKQRSHS